MIVINANDATPTITILPNINVSAFVDGISGYFLEFIDDETQDVFTFGNGQNFEIEADFFQIDINNSNGDLKAEKYYTMRMINSTTNLVVYRDKAFVTTQTQGIKYNNNENQFVPANSGNNDYILL
tara:strand:+ start:2886 stop:3263 length:378 start_codon:yes stop_codon:yes gene_type:complete